MSQIDNRVLPGNDRGRRRHILRVGILFYALPVFAVTSAWRWYDTYGWHAAPQERLQSEIIRLFIELTLWTTAGYFFARRMWYERHVKAAKGRTKES